TGLCAPLALSSRSIWSWMRSRNFGLSMSISLMPMSCFLCVAQGEEIEFAFHNGSVKWLGLGKWKRCVIPFADYFRRLIQRLVARVSLPLSQRLKNDLFVA